MIFFEIFAHFFTFFHISHEFFKNFPWFPSWWKRKTFCETIFVSLLQTSVVTQNHTHIECKNGLLQIKNHNCSRLLFCIQSVVGFSVLDVMKKFFSILYFYIIFFQQKNSFICCWCSCYYIFFRGVFSVWIGGVWRG